MKELKEWIKSFLFALVIVIPVSYFATPAIVEGSSMQPTLYDNNIVIMDKHIKEIKHGDVVIFDANPIDDRYYIKRIIGLPGEYVKIKDGNVYVNNIKIAESYLKSGTLTEPDMSVIVPENEYFVLGDNREVSEDSRFIGTIPAEKIKGLVYFKVYPFRDAGKF
jgi:signal peptidase I